MTMQRVNLYLPELRTKKEWLTANTIALSVVGFCLLMVVAVVFTKQGLKDYEEKVAVLENQKRGAETRVNRIKNMSRSSNSYQLDRRLSHLKRSVVAREQIGQIIQGQNLGNEAGFAMSMNQFAKHSSRSISLDHIRISRGGNFVEMEGVAKVIEDVPLYIQLLRQEESFTDVQFGLLSIAKNNKRRGQHKFALGFDSVYRLASDRSAD